MLRPLRDDAPAASGRNRAELPSVTRSGAETRRPREGRPTLSLHAKIFIGYLVLGGVLFATSRLLATYGVTQLWLEATITLAVAGLFGVLLPSSLARVSRAQTNAGERGAEALELFRIGADVVPRSVAVANGAARTVVVASSRGLVTAP